MDGTPDRQEGSYNDGGADSQGSKAKRGPQQAWHERIQQRRRAARGRSSEAEIAEKGQPDEQRGGLQMIDP